MADKLDGLTEVDAIETAIIETEREIAGEAWDQEDTERDDTGRGLEEMGSGLEGQHEPEEDEDADGETEGDDDSEGEEEEAAAEGEKKPEAEAEAGKKVGEVQPTATREKPAGNVPSGMLREANERARIAETERDALKAELAKTGQTLEQKLDAVTRELAEIRRNPPAAPKVVEPPKAEVVPDLFENPTAFVDHLKQDFRTELGKRDKQIADQRVESSMAIAHAFHKDTFETAFAALTKLDASNPEAAQTVRRIYSSPNPGEALVSWHKREVTRARVGDDVEAYEANVRKQEREALMKDPEFRKSLLADLRGDAERGDNGKPRTSTRVPPSLHRAQGSNVGADRGERHESDDSDAAVAEAAWR